MADTLFGMNPEDIQAMRQAEAQKNAMAVAGMKPAQQAQYGAYIAADQLGTALGGMMGAKDPVLERATAVNKLAQQTDMNDLDSVKNLVTQLNKAGATREAMSLLPRIDKLTEAAAERQTKKDVAASKKNDFFQTLITGGKYSPESVAAFQESGDYRDLKVDTRSKANMTGPERMLSKVADVSTRLFNKEEVPEGEIREAEAIREYLSKPHTYVDPETKQTVTVAGVALPPLRGQTMTTTSSTGGVVTSSPTAPTSTMRVETGPGALKIKEKEAQSILSASADITNTIEAANQALGLAPNNMTSGALYPLLKNIPWTDSKALSNIVGKLKSDVGLGKLQELKRLSSTGASGLGATSQKEIDLLIDSLTALDPTDKNIKAQIATIVTRFDRLKKSMADDYLKASGKSLPDMKPDNAPTSKGQMKTKSGVTYSVEKD